jgi:hypothetical protein
MKKLTATLLASSLLGLAAYAQGTINFVNVNNGVGLNSPVTFFDGTTKVPTTGFTAELFAGPDAGSLVSVATATFIAPGYFNGGTATINSVLPGAVATLQVRVWSTASGSFAAAQAANVQNTWGQSGVFTLATGGGGTPASPPAAMAGLQSFSLNGVPEPSSLALAGLGAAAMLVFRRRK